MNMLTPNDIKQIRADLRLTAKQFADRLGISIDTVFAWESGRRHPTYRRMIDINKLADTIRKQPA